MISLFALGGLGASFTCFTATLTFFDSFACFGELFAFSASSSLFLFTTVLSGMWVFLYFFQTWLVNLRFWFFRSWSCTTFISIIPWGYFFSVFRFELHFHPLCYELPKNSLLPHFPLLLDLNLFFLLFYYYCPWWSMCWGSYPYFAHCFRHQIVESVAQVNFQWNFTFSSLKNNSYFISIVKLHIRPFKLEVTLTLSLRMILPLRTVPFALKSVNQNVGFSCSSLAHSIWKCFRLIVPNFRNENFDFNLTDSPSKFLSNTNGFAMLHVFQMVFWSDLRSYIRY